MPAKEVEFHEEARDEVLAARDWYAERSEAIAAGFVEELAHAVDLVGSAPRRWPGYVSNTRRFLLRRYPFAIIYREFASHILVVALAHMHRRPGYWRGRT